jgi:hypothetical protein
MKLAKGVAWRSPSLLALLRRQLEKSGLRRLQLKTP